MGGASISGHAKDVACCLGMLENVHLCASFVRALCELCASATSTVHIRPLFYAHKVSFKFHDPPELTPPYIQVNDVAFQYDNGPKIFSQVNLGVWPSSRIAIVGANGAGKSTLLNLLTGDLDPSSGQVYAPLSPCPQPALLLVFLRSLLYGMSDARR